MNLPFEPADRKFGLSNTNAFMKRSMDIILAAILFILMFWLIAVLAIFARLSTGKSGIFRQERVGLYGDPFTLYKIRTMRDLEGHVSTTTTGNDVRITPFGHFLRRLKLDETPQLINILNGTMSFVGPRPDVASVYKGLNQEEYRVLTIRPGVTGPASIHFREEEAMLSEVDDPEAYSQNVIFPQKVRLNIEYIEQYSIMRDMSLMLQTVAGKSGDIT